MLIYTRKRTQVCKSFNGLFVLMFWQKKWTIFVVFLYIFYFKHFLHTFLLIFHNNKMFYFIQLPYEVQNYFIVRKDYHAW